MKRTPQKIIAYVIAAISIAVPILLFFWNSTAAGISLILGLYIAYRAIRFGGQEEKIGLSDTEAAKLDRHQIDRGTVIRVQLVDEYGRDLPEHIKRQLLVEACAKAGPRDTVVGVRHKIQKAAR